MTCAEQSVLQSAVPRPNVSGRKAPLVERADSGFGSGSTPHSARFAAHFVRGIRPLDLVRSGLRFFPETISRLQPALPRLLSLAADCALLTPANPLCLTRVTQALAAAAQFALRAQPTRRLRRGCISLPFAEPPRRSPPLRFTPQYGTRW